MIAYKQVLSPNFGYPRGAHGQNNPVAILYHITGSRPTSPPLAGLDSWFRNPLAGSTHVGIQDSEAHQYVQFDDACWGAGYLDKPDLTNPHVWRWWQRGINPNVETIQVEVVSMPGKGDVARGTRRVNAETWETMKRVGIDIVERYPSIELVAFDWLGHYQNDSVSRGRDPKTVYWPVDILEEILEDMQKQEDDNMIQILRIGRGENLSWTPHTFVSDGFGTRHVTDPDAMAELQDAEVWPTEEKRISWNALQQLVDDPSELPDLGFGD